MCKATNKVICLKNINLKMEEDEQGNKSRAMKCFSWAPEQWCWEDILELLHLRAQTGCWTVVALDKKRTASGKCTKVFAHLLTT